MARLLVVDDDPGTTELVTFTLANEGHDVHAAADAGTALREFPMLQPEAVILDVSLPDSNGMEVCAAIRAISRVPVLLLTGRASLQDKARGFKSGADDYLVKPFSPAELALRVEALLRRSAWSNHLDSTMTVGELEIDGRAREVRRSGQAVPVSQMEMDILAALASTPGVPWSPEKLALRLGLSVDSQAEAAELMRVKISRLRRKIEIDPRMPNYLRSRRGAGYLLSADESIPADGEPSEVE